MSVPRVRLALALGAVLAALAFTLSAGPSGPPPLQIQVYKSPTCGCCTKWVEHLRANGFAVSTTDLPDVSGVKDEYRVPGSLRSCHTALVEGYVIEGHVPAEAIRRLVKEHPKLAGLAVPGMPMGSPGMEGLTREHYEVVGFDGEGKTQVYTRY